jgi:hypothetical protein
MPGVTYNVILSCGVVELGLENPNPEDPWLQCCSEVIARRVLDVGKSWTIITIFLLHLHNKKEFIIFYIVPIQDVH